MVDGIIDTSILIDVLRNKSDAITWLSAGMSSKLAITPIVWMEIMQGATDKQKRQQFLKFLKRFTVEYATETDTKWAMLQLARFSLSHGIEITDLLIASVAVRLGVPLYTLNVKHFAPLPSLQVITPY